METPRHGRAAALVVSLSVMGSRVLGLVREQVFAALFGAGRELDAFLAAFQIPNLLRDLFAEGALSTAFTTVFAQTTEQEGDRPAWRLACLVLSSLILVLGLICLAGILLSPLLVNATSFGFHAVPGKFALTVRLTRILFPFILFISLAAAVMGMLNARYVFAVPALAPMAFNVMSVVGGVAFAYLFEPQSDWLRPRFTDRALSGLAVGVLLGGLAQLAVQWPALRRQGFRFRWQLDFRDPRLLRVWRLMWPAAIAASAVEVNVLINGQFASAFDGARSWLSCAFRILYFPIGMFGVAVATITLPSVARMAARQSRALFGQTAENALRLSLFLSLPAAAGLFALAPEVVRLVYEHGRFSAADTAQTALALRAYVFGLAGYAGAKVLIPCFHALDKPRLPLRVNLIAIGVNLALNALLVGVFGFRHAGVAAATAGVMLTNFLLLAWLLRREAPLGAIRRWLAWLAVTGAGSLLCGTGAWAVARLLQARVSGLAGQLLTVGLAVGAGFALFAAFTLACRLPEARASARILLRKLRLARAA